MESIETNNGSRLLGQGQAVVLEVSTSNEDNHQVKINHPDLGETPFIPYIQTSGVYKIPKVGEIVYVFCKEGFHSYPVAWGSKLGPESVKALIGTRDNRLTMLYSTGNDHKSISHTVILDDGEDRGVRITTAGGNKIDMKNDGTILISQVNGNTVTMSSGSLELKRGESTTTLTDNSISIKSTTVSIEADSVTVKGESSVTVEGGDSKVDVSSTVTVEGGDTQSSVDGIIVSTHNHKFGNLGYPTDGGPINA